MKNYWEEFYKRAGIEMEPIIETPDSPDWDTMTPEEREAFVNDQPSVYDMMGGDPPIFHETPPSGPARPLELESMIAILKAKLKTVSVLVTVPEDHIREEAIEELKHQVFTALMKEFGLAIHIDHIEPIEPDDELGIPGELGVYRYGMVLTGKNPVDDVPTHTVVDYAYLFGRDQRDREFIEAVNNVGDELIKKLGFTT